jgi:hypothetical protein
MKLYRYNRASQELMWTVVYESLEPRRPSGNARGSSDRFAFFGSP